MQGNEQCIEELKWLACNVLMTSNEKSVQLTRELGHRQYKIRISPKVFTP